MAIYRGTGGAGDSTTDATVSDVTEQATIASTKASEAAASATNAATSASQAASSATSAANSAANAASVVSGIADDAAAAEAAKLAAQAAQAAAELAETGAETAETNAETANTNAASSASAASTSATNAANSASSAATSASNASTSASAAATSATDASTSASSAATSATSAATSAGTATTQATAAAASATSASNSAAAAASSASAASTSATNAATSETNAATSAANASTSETNASTSETAAAGSAASASTSASNAATSATSASNSASAASTSATNAAASETAAAGSASAASASADAALAALDNFDDRYLGQKASAPTVDNDGDPLVTGALYFDTTDDAMKVWDGTQWLNAYASLSGALIANNNLSDLTNAATARTNLGLGTAATTDSTAYATAAQGALADAALPASSYTAADVLTKVKTVDGSGSGLDADTVDGLHSTDVVETSDGVTTNLNTEYDAKMFGWTPSTTGAPDAGYGQGISIINNGKTHNNSNNWITQLGFGTTDNTSYFRTKVNANAWSAWRTIWNSANDGAGSGLDADLLDGQQGTYYAAASSLSNYLPLSGGAITGDVTFGDNDKAIFGAGSDLQIFHSGSHSYLQDNGTGNLFIEGQQTVISGKSSGNWNAQFVDNGDSIFYHSTNGEKARVNSTGVDVTGTVTADGIQLDSNDQYILAGAGAGLKIGHDASSSIIRSQVGPMYIDGNGITFRGYSPYTKHMDIATNGDISFYEDTGTTAKFFWDASAEQLNLTGSSTSLNVLGTTQSIAGGKSNIKVGSSDAAAADKGGQINFTANTVSLSNYPVAGIHGYHETLGAGNYSGYLGLYTTSSGGAITERMRIDSSGRVGIGTTAPTRALDVSKAGSTILANFKNTGGTTSFITLGNTSSTADQIRVGSNGTAFTVSTNYTERMRIDSAGNVGIGTSSPKGPLHVYGTEYSYFTSNVAGVTPNSTTQGVAIGWNKSGGLGESIIAHNKGGGATGGLVFANNDGGVYREDMRIDSAGNVGIGTASPAAKLDVNGTAKAANLQETVYNLTGTALDAGNGGIQTKTLTANTTLTDSLTAGQSMTLMIDDGSAYTITWPTITWLVSGGSAPTLETTGYTAIVLWKVGSTLYGKY